MPSLELRFARCCQLRGLSRPKLLTAESAEPAEPTLFLCALCVLGGERLWVREDATINPCDYANSAVIGFPTPSLVTYTGRRSTT